MARVDKPVTIDKFLGLNLVDDPNALVSEEEKLVGGIELTKADNIDIDNKYRIRRRQGLTEVLTGTDMHSLWSNDAGTRAFYLDDGDLKEITVNGGAYSSSNVVTGLSPNSRIYFCDVFGDIYYSNGSVLGRIGASGQEDWAVENPQGQPTLASNGSGALFAGKYMVVVTYVHSDGRESGSSKTAADITTTTVGGLTITSIPQPSSANIDYVRVYMTPANGDQFYFVKQVAAGTTSTTIAGPHRDAIPLRTHLLSAPFAGKYLSYSQGRVFWAVDGYVYYTNPMMYHLMDMKSNWMPFSQDVGLIVGLDDSLYVSSDKIYRVVFKDSGEPDFRQIANYPAIPGNVCYVDASDIGKSVKSEGKVGVIATEQGICMLGAGGEFLNLTKNRVDFGESGFASTIIKKQRGITQIASFLRMNNTGSNLYASDVAEATILKYNERMLFDGVSIGDTADATVS